MSISTGSDGEVRMGHYGDYSDWVKKYHLGKHVPFRATKVTRQHLFGCAKGVH